MIRFLKSTVHPKEGGLFFLLSDKKLLKVSYGL